MRDKVLLPILVHYNSISFIASNSWLPTCCKSWVLRSPKVCCLPREWQWFLHFFFFYILVGFEKLLHALLQFGFTCTLRFQKHQISRTFSMSKLRAWPFYIRIMIRGSNSRARWRIHWLSKHVANISLEYAYINYNFLLSFDWWFRASLRPNNVISIIIFLMTCSKFLLKKY